MTSDDSQVVYIIGAGHAGSEVAMSLRQQGCSSPVVLIGEEPYAPYQRPPLSKTYLTSAETPCLRLRQPAAYEKANVRLMLGTRVEQIDPRARSITLSDQRRLVYWKLVLATGGRARKLSGADGERAEAAANFHYLRTLDDAMKIRERFLAGRRLVVIGGGFIGLEVAAAAVAHGLRVTVLEASPRVLARVTSEAMSLFYESVHRSAGVDLRTGVAVSGFEFDHGGSVIAVRCGSGEVVAADVVIAGVGIAPDVELAHCAGLHVDNGIVVDEYARTSDPHILAAGDCTSQPQAFLGRRMRIESVPNAVEQARTAAATLAGGQRPHTGVPWFWSDQYNLKLQMAGLSQDHDQTIVRGSMLSRSFTILYARAGRLVACDAVNRPQDFMVSKQLIAAGAASDSARLADETVPLKSFLRHE